MASLDAWESTHIGLHGLPATRKNQSKATVQPTIVKPTLVDPQTAFLVVDSHMAAYMSIAPSGAVAASPADCLAGAHNAIAQNSEGTHYFSSYAPHEKSKGQAPPVKHIIPYGLQQLPPTVLEDTVHAATPTSELASVEAGLTATELQLPPLLAGPSIHLHQHCGVTLTENTLRDVGQNLDQSEVLPLNSIESVFPSNSPSLDDPNMMPHPTPADPNMNLKTSSHLPQFM
ncbi:hypothetical protein F0562_025471 [Nyssa sinensis]|uniref:Uncharacterized protein n=1 Tax=Nyssa sinensis TaxID=561372 RepID=A0A5J5B7W3_9ASTE|nr:hypothetical protein F0562_025471 [Nyssa sinensis]